MHDVNQQVFGGHVNTIYRAYIHIEFWTNAVSSATIYGKYFPALTLLAGFPWDTSVVSYYPVIYSRIIAGY